MASRTRRKPKKPHSTFPLTAHPNGQWCKKILGKLHFFGVWAEPQVAHQNYLRIAEDLHAGQEPVQAEADELTLKTLGNQFLAYQLRRVDIGQIGARNFEDYRRVIRHFAKSVGSARAVATLTANDFLRYRHLIANRGFTGRMPLGMHGILRAIVAVKGMFNWAMQSGLIEHLPRYGQAFAKPSAADMRRNRAKQEREHGKRLFSAEQIRELLEAASTSLRAAILLGINGGFGNTDCSQLPVAAIDLENALIEFERPKTAVRRVVPLWDETVDAIQAVLQAGQPSAATREAEGLLFRSELGHPLVRQVVRRNDGPEAVKVTSVDRLSDWFDAALKQLGMKRRGLGFYSLRHTFRTWADEAGDQHAVHRIMGHSLPGMSGVYVEEISVQRLRRVVELVRTRLWPQIKVISRPAVLAIR